MTTNSPNGRPNDHRSNKLLIVGLGAGGMLILGLLIWMYAKDLRLDRRLPFEHDQLDKLGSFLAGTAGPIFALIGVVLFALALDYQRKELHQTREVFEDQSTTQKLQRFENTFFQLLTFHNGIVSSIVIPNLSYSDIKKTGKDAFVELYSRLKHEFGKGLSTENLLTGYMNVYTEFQHALGHYFRNLYHVLKIVNESGLGEKERRKYSSIVRAQLSSHELVFLYYNGLGEYGREKFKPIIENYALLENMDVNLLIEGTTPDIWYKPEAFGDIKPVGETFNKEERRREELFDMLEDYSPPTSRENSVKD